MFRVLIALGQKRPEPRRGRLEQIKQIVIVEDFVADDIDLSDLGNLALGDIEIYGDAIPLQRSDGAGDSYAVSSLIEIGATQLLLHRIENGSIEDPSGGKADIIERLLQVFGFDSPVSGKFDAGDRWTFTQEYDQRVAFTLDGDVSEETGFEKRSNGLSGAAAVYSVADADGQVIENSAGGNSLQTLEANFFHHKRFLRGRLRGRGEQQYQCNKKKGPHATYAVCCRSFRSLERSLPEPRSRSSGPLRGANAADFRKLDQPNMRARSL